MPNWLAILYAAISGDDIQIVAAAGILPIVVIPLIKLIEQALVGGATDLG